MEPSKTHHIMIVDDEPINIQLLGDILKSDYRLTVATNGRQALDLASSQPPDLILLDIRMPVMDGFQVCEALQQHERLSTIPVIFITAMNRHEDEIHGLRLGAVDFISKPVAAEVVRARIRTQITLLQQKQQLIEQKDQLAASSALLAATLESTRDGVLVVNSKGQVVLYNQCFCDMWNITGDRLTQEGLAGLIRYTAAQAVNGEQDSRRLGEMCSAGANETDTLEFKDGRVLNSFAMPLAQGVEVDARVITFTDVTEQRYLEEQLRELAVTDALTGVNNRRKLDELIPREIDRALRYGYQLGLMVIDIDYYKQINDRYGHEAGDQILINFARVMIRSFRSVDHCCRFGGDEFVVIMPNTDLAGMQDASQRFLRQLREMAFSDARITASIGGVVCACKSQLDCDSWLFAQADQCLYQAKEQGRDRAVIKHLDADQSVDSPPPSD